MSNISIRGITEMYFNWNEGLKSAMPAELAKGEYYHATDTSELFYGKADGTIQRAGYFMDSDIYTAFSGDPTADTIIRQIGIHQHVLNNEVYNVRDFGAKGDGVTDDTAAINDATLAAAGKTLIFPGNIGEVYNVSGEIEVHSNSRYISDGARIAVCANTHVFTADSALTNIEFSGMKFSATAGTHTDKYVFAFLNNGGISKSRFTNLQFENLSTLLAVMRLGDAKDVVIHDIIADSCGLVIELRGVTDSCDNNRIENITVRNSNTAVALVSTVAVPDSDDPDGTIVRHTSLNNIYAEKCTNCGVVVYGGYDISVRKVTVIDSWSDESALTRCGVRFQGVVQGSLSDLFITRMGEEHEALYVDDSDVMDEIHSTLVHGLSLENCKHILVSNVHTSHTNGNGITLQEGGEDITISQCLINETKVGDGIAIHGTAVKGFRNIIISDVLFKNLSYDYWQKYWSTGLESVNTVGKPYNGGIFTEYTENFQFTNCIAERCGRGISLGEETRNGVCRNWYIDTMTQCGITLTDIIAEDIEFSDIIIKNVGTVSITGYTFKNSGVVFTAADNNNLTFRDVVISDSDSNMQYGFAVGDGNSVSNVKLSNVSIQDYISDKYRLPGTQAFLEEGYGNASSNFINIKSCGAKGDGVTDDYAILNTILNLATALTYGGTIYFPAGVYLLNSSVTVPENVTLQFENGAKLLIGDGTTLTVNGYIDAGNYRIVQYNGTITGDTDCIQGAPKNTSLIADWFGVIPDGTTDYDANKLLAFALQTASSTGITLHFRKGYYASPLNNGYSNVSCHFETGAIFGGTIHVAINDDANTASSNRPSNIRFTGEVGSYDRVGMYNCDNVFVERICIYDDVTKSLGTNPPNGGGVHIYQQSKDVTINSIYIENSSRNYGLGIDSTLTEQPENISIGVLHIKESKVHGISIRGKNIHIGRALIEAYGTGTIADANVSTDLPGSLVDHTNLRGVICYEAHECSFGDLTILQSGTTGANAYDGLYIGNSEVSVGRCYIESASNNGIAIKAGGFLKGDSITVKSSDNHGCSITSGGSLSVREIVSHNNTIRGIDALGGMYVEFLHAYNNGSEGVKIANTSFEIVSLITSNNCLSAENFNVYIESSYGAIQSITATCSTSGDSGGLFINGDPGRSIFIGQIHTNNVGKLNYASLHITSSKKISIMNGELLNGAWQGMRILTVEDCNFNGLRISGNSTSGIAQSGMTRIGFMNINNADGSNIASGETGCTEFNCTGVRN